MTAKYVIQGEFLDFHNKQAYTIKDLGGIYNIGWTAFGFGQWASTYKLFEDTFDEENTKNLNLHNGEYLASYLYDGVLLQLHVPNSERNRISELLRGQDYANGQYLRDLYIHWNGTQNKFDTLKAKMTSITEAGCKSRLITLTELIGTGKVLTSLPSPLQTTDEQRAKELLDLFLNTFYVVVWRLHRKTSWLRRLLSKEQWWWSSKVQLLEAENTHPRKREEE